MATRGVGATLCNRTLLVITLVKEVTPTLFNGERVLMVLPLVQVAVDTTSLVSARALIHAARESGADWIELGKPLVEFVGLTGLAELAPDLEGAYVLVDLMIVAGAEKYVRAVAELGFQNVTVTALAPEETVVEAIECGKRYGVAVTVDLFNTADPLALATRYAGQGADYVMVHFGVDQKRRSPAGSPIQLLADVADHVSVPVSYATYDLAESRQAVDAGASVIVQGEPLLSSPEPRQALSEFIQQTKAHSGRKPSK